MAEVPGVVPARGAIAVIFVAQRTHADDAGYGEMANRMDALAATQPGYLGIDSVRDAGGLGITVSYWADEASARAWKAEAEHSGAREMGRTRWYQYYRLIVTRVERGYSWARPD